MDKIIHMKQSIKNNLTSLVILLAVFTSISIVNIGCRNIITIQEDGSGRDCSGEYWGPTAAVRALGSCRGSTTLEFTSETAYQNFMSRASQSIQSMEDGYSKSYLQQELDAIERGRYPPGRSGIVDFPSTTTEGSFGTGGSSGGGGKGGGK
jgi:hypothetical protein